MEGTVQAVTSEKHGHDQDQMMKKGTVLLSPFPEKVKKEPSPFHLEYQSYLSYNKYKEIIAARAAEMEGLICINYGKH